MKQRKIKKFNLASLVIITPLVYFTFAAGCVTDRNDSNIPEEQAGAKRSYKKYTNCWDYQGAEMAPKPGWDKVDMEGLTREELVEVLGCPPHVIRQTSAVSLENNRELWVYHPYEKDPTGLYIWIKGDFYHYLKTDAFNGFRCNQMGDPDFWE